MSHTAATPRRSHFINSSSLFLINNT